MNKDFFTGKKASWCAKMVILSAVQELVDFTPDSTEAELDGIIRAVVRVLRSYNPDADVDRLMDEEEGAPQQEEAQVGEDEENTFEDDVYIPDPLDGMSDSFKSKARVLDHIESIITLHRADVLPSDEMKAEVLLGNTIQTIRKILTDYDAGK